MEADIFKVDHKVKKNELLAGVHMRRREQA